MAVLKRCKYDGCTASACTHPWWIKTAYKNEVAYGSWKKFRFLLAPGAIVKSKKDAEALDGLVLNWIKDAYPGKPVYPDDVPPPSTPEPAPTPAADEPDNPTPRTIPDALTAYDTEVGHRLNDKGYASILKRLTREFGVHADGRPRDLFDLFDPVVVSAYLTRVERVDGFGRPRPAPSLASRNATLRRLRPITRWIRAHYKRHEPRLRGVELPYFDSRDNLDSSIKVEPLDDARETRPTAKQHAAILTAARALPDGDLMEGRILAAEQTGLRLSALLTITNDQIVSTKCGPAIQMRKRARSKSNKRRVIPIVTPALRKFVNARRFHKYIFGTRDGARPLAVHEFKHLKNKIWLAAGLETRVHVKRVSMKTGKRYSAWVVTSRVGLRWHDYRHDFASALGDDNVPQKQIQEATGHSTLEQSGRYTNPAFDQFYRNVERAIRKHTRRRA